MTNATQHPKVLWIKDAYLAEILSGQKTIEVRVGYSNILRLRPGSPLLLNERHRARVRRITVYPTFAALVEAEDASRIAPGTARAELLSALRTLYPPDKEALGAVALEIELLDAEET
jgi:ASC-1-like (ASCH) protein